MSAPIATTKISQDFTVSDTGEGYISQRECERLLNLTSGTISRFVSQRKKNSTLKLNEKNQLHEETLVFVSTHYAEKGSKQALKLLSKFAQAGARAYIYSAAGYVPNQLIPVDPYAELRTISIPEQWVYEAFPGRKCGSLHKTMMEGYHRSRGTPLHDQVVYEGGMLRFSPMFLLSIQFAKQDGFAFKAFVCSVLGTDALPAPETILTVSFDGDALGVIV